MVESLEYTAEVTEKDLRVFHNFVCKKNKKPLDKKKKFKKDAILFFAWVFILLIVQFLSGKNILELCSLFYNRLDLFSVFIVLFLFGFFLLIGYYQLKTSAQFGWGRHLLCKTLTRLDETGIHQTGKYWTAGCDWQGIIDVTELKGQILFLVSPMAGYIVVTEGVMSEEERKELLEFARNKLN